LAIIDSRVHIPSKGWAMMIGKVYELDPLVRTKRQGQMCIIAFFTEYTVVDRILNHVR
jgi:hypothetical protein